MPPADTPDTKPRSWRRHLRLRPGFLAIVGLTFAAAWAFMIAMPGRSARGELPPPTKAQLELQALLLRHVTTLAVEIGPRSTMVPEGLERAAEYLEAELRTLGYAPRRQTYTVHGLEVSNIEVELAGTTAADEIVVIGAHYDAVGDVPGANDNGSGCAALLALAERFRAASPVRTLRFVFFVNEEPPHFQTEHMGSLVYARRCRERGDDVRVMWSLETLGCFFDEPGSQHYPLPMLRFLYPSEGNFIAFVGNLKSRALLRATLRSFREKARFPSEGAALPSGVPGVGWSDQWSFWQVGYPAIMVTDTAPFRYPQYHTREDLPEHIDYDRFARVVDGLALVLAGVLDS